jgi:hypothetical protein
LINEIVIENKRTGENITINKDGSTGFVIDEMDWDTPSISNESYRIPFQIGETISSTFVGTRKPKLTGYVVSNKLIPTGTTWEDYYKEQEQDITNLKTQLNGFLNIYDDYEIIAGDYYLKCRLNEPIKYSAKESENNEVLCLFTAQFTCYNPMFLEVGGNESEFRHIDEEFHFPLIIPEGTGIIMGIETSSTTKTIENGGDVKVGFIVIMRVLNGIVKYPALRNLTTGEQIKVFDSVVVDSFEAEDYIVINTNNGEENIYYYDSLRKTTKDLIGEITSDSVFFQLQKGENVVMYEVDDSSTGQLEVTLYYDNQYFNIGAM